VHHITLNAKKRGVMIIKTKS